MRHRPDDDHRSRDAVFDGGGIWNAGGDAILRRSVVRRNTADVQGGGIHVNGGLPVVRLANATITANATARWRFTSLDPITKQPPADPLAGFLPPNAKPPEGDGFVTFTVDANPAVTTGTQIANEARIVFDANPPIDTPVWTNAIDDAPPTSQVVSATAVGGCSRDVVVGWTGTDPGAGIAAFTIEASENGGPFAPWTTSGATTGVFHGKSGKPYVFRSVATDLAGNVQAAPSAPSPEVTVPSCDPYDLAVLSMKMPAKVKLLRTRPTVKKLAKIAIQNRGVAPMVITDAESLGELVTLTAESLGSCGDATVTLHEGKPQKPFPIGVARPRRCQPRPKTASVGRSRSETVSGCAGNAEAAPGLLVA